ncbi:MAG: ferrous iron transport protein A [Deltaproteobacteria bacterium]|nr:ferrous iron transport protein A [Deltaproteobacteria bacterium]
MTLEQVPKGSRVKVVKRTSGQRFAASMDGMGIHVGDELVVVGSAPFSGPILVEVPASGIQVALGRGMAKKLQVEPVSA